MDFALTMKDGTGFDLAHDGTDLVLDDGLVTGLIDSIFTDARAPDGAVPNGVDPRGHWMSTYDPSMPDGSLLWLMNREKITPDMPYRVAEALAAACAWMEKATSGPAQHVVHVRAVSEKAAVRGRINAGLTVELDRAPFIRRFAITYDLDGRTFALEENT